MFNLYYQKTAFKKMYIEVTFLLQKSYFVLWSFDFLYTRCQ